MPTSLFSKVVYLYELVGMCFPLTKWQYVNNHSEFFSNFAKCVSCILRCMKLRNREISDLVKNLAISQLGEICPKFFTAISLIFYYLSEIWRTSQNLNFNPHCVGAFCNRWDYLSTNTKSLLFNIPFRPSSNLILYIAILHCHFEVKEYFPGIESSRVSLEVGSGS